MCASPGLGSQACDLCVSGFYVGSGDGAQASCLHGRHLTANLSIVHFLFCLFVFTLMYYYCCMCMCIQGCMCEGQRITWRNQFSPSAMLVLGIKLSLSGSALVPWPFIFIRVWGLPQAIWRCRTLLLTLHSSLSELDLFPPSPLPPPQDVCIHQSLRVCFSFHPCLSLILTVGISTHPVLTPET